jgi:UPF0755 protein
VSARRSAGTRARRPRPAAPSGTKSADRRRRKHPGARRPRGDRALALGLVVLVMAGLALGLWAMPERFPNRLRALIPGQVERVLVVEGADVFHVARLLETRNICPAGSFRDAARDRTLLAKFGIDAESVEGYLAPATYEFFHDSPAAEVVQKMLSVRQRELEELRRRPLPPPLGSLHEAIIIGSLVEREAQKDDERPRIARVFLNRLVDLRGETRGRLQSDPAAVYGCLAQSPPPSGCEGMRLVESSRTVTPAMLRSDTNSYNTYRKAGLPPGPICNPGRRSLLAALEPAAGDLLYFVADGHGGHHFSATYAEHRHIVNERAGGGR